MVINLENIEYKNNLILSDVIIARSSLKDIILCNNSYDNLLPESCRFSNIVHCELRNISENYIIKNNEISITFNFDLLIIYEFIISTNNIKEYSLYSERLSRTINIPRQSYGILSDSIDFKSVLCRNMLKDIKYSYDIDMSYSILSVNISCSVDSLLIKKDVLELTPLPMQKVDASREEAAASSIIQVNQTESLASDNMESSFRHLDNLLKESSKISDLNKKLEKELSLKNKKISSLEYTYAKLQEKYNKLSEDIQSKNQVIEELKKNMDKAENKLSILQSTNQVMDLEIKELQKENADLKAIISDLESRIKNQLNNKIKNALSNILYFK